ncbi:MAG TPA: tetratricopeptide repeat protein, partial [Longimicrobium sp.]
PPPRAAFPPPAEPPRPAPVIPARRAPEPEPRGGAGKILAGGALLLLLGGGGVVAYQQMNSDRGTEPALSELADSARVDSTGTADTVTIVDAAVLSLEGRRMITEGNFAGAAESFQRALQADPTKAEYRDGYAYALLRLDRAEEAERVLLEAIRIDRDYDLLYSHLADARLARGDTVGAISALERFINLTLDRQDQETARRKLDALTQVQVVVPPPPTIDSTVVAPTPIPADPGVPRDTIRLGPPGR